MRAAQQQVLECRCERSTSAFVELDGDLRVGTEAEIVVHDVEREVVGGVHARVVRGAAR